MSKPLIIVTVNAGVANVSTNIKGAEIRVYDFDDIQQGGDVLVMESDDCGFEPSYPTMLDNDLRMEKERIEKYFNDMKK